jgi:hypothetical protein
VTIPAKLCRYHLWRRLHDSDLVQLFNLVTTLTPTALTQAGVFLFDSDRAILGRSWNAFFEITDTRFAALANSEVVIAGEHVQVTKVMVFSRRWIWNNYTSPLAEFRRFADDARRRIAAAAIETPLYTSPSEEQSFAAPEHDASCLIWWRPLCTGSNAVLRTARKLWAGMICFTFLMLCALIYFATCYDRYPWILLHSRPLDIFIGILVVGIVCAPLHYLIVVNGRPCFLGVAIALLALTITGVGGLMIAIYCTDMEESIREASTRQDLLELTQQVENRMGCCGWSSVVEDSRCYDHGRRLFPRCEELLHEQTPSLKYAFLGAGLALGVGQLLLVLRTCAAEESGEFNADDW